jgi:Zn-finger nucleic acid-binding protein
MTVRMRCACEAQNPLLPAQLPRGPAASTCEACGGALLALADYRRWREQAPYDFGDSPGILVVEDSTAARPCPSCARLMQRLRVGGTPDFRIDRCPACALLWLDRGEWDALRANGLALHVEEILSERSQRDLQAGEVRALRAAQLREKHGDERMAELERMRDWLQAQPQRDELLALLRAGW